MPCRIGMTTDRDERLRYWKNQYPTLKNWAIISTHGTKTEAQWAENLAASSGGCESNPGGDGP